MYTHTHIYPISRRQTGEHKSRQPSKHSNLGGVFDSIFPRSSSVFTPIENSFVRECKSGGDPPMTDRLISHYPRVFIRRPIYMLMQKVSLENCLSAGLRAIPDLDGRRGYRPRIRNSRRK